MLQQIRFSNSLAVASTEAVVISVMLSPRFKKIEVVYSVVAFAFVDMVNGFLDVYKSAKGFFCNKYMFRNPTMLIRSGVVRLVNTLIGVFKKLLSFTIALLTTILTSTQFNLTIKYFHFLATGLAVLMRGAVKCSCTSLKRAINGAVFATSYLYFRWEGAKRSLTNRTRDYHNLWLIIIRCKKYGIYNIKNQS